MAHSLYSSQRPEYHSLTSGCLKAHSVSFRICSSCCADSMIPSKRRRSMAGGTSSVVRITENRLCNNCPCRMYLSPVSSSPRINSAERLDCLNSMLVSSVSRWIGKRRATVSSLLPDTCFPLREMRDRAFPVRIFLLRWHSSFRSCRIRHFPTIRIPFLSVPPFHI